MMKNKTKGHEKEKHSQVTRLTFLFSILATERRKQLNVNEKILKNKDVLEALQCNFDETKVKKFLAACKKHFKKTGKILPMRKLNPNLRPIMDYLKTFDRLSLEELMKK